MSTRPADWFHNAVIEGVQLLVALNLADRPAAEVLPITAGTWVEVLWRWLPWNEALDARRLRDGFAGLAASVERWPAPHQLRGHMPARSSELLVLPSRGNTAPPEIAARLAQTRAALRGIDRREKSSFLASGNIGTAESQADTDAAGRGDGVVDE